MAKLILMDEFHVTASAPGGLRESQYQAMRRALDGAALHADVVAAVRAVFRRYPALRRVRVRVSR